MGEPGELAWLIDGLERGALSRRDFVAHALTVGLGLTSIGLLLSACGEQAKAPPVSRPPASDLGPIEKELRIYNWSDYIAERTVPDFEKEFGVTVAYETYESNEELVARLQAQTTGYDIVVPSAYVVPVLVAADLVGTIDKAYLTNWDSLSPIFQNLASDPGNAHTVPWQWGTTGIAYRADKVPFPVDSWAIFHDRQFRGRMTMVDDGREVIGSQLRLEGHSLNSIIPEELAQAKADAIHAKRNLKGYVSAPVKPQLISGEVWIAQLWNGDTAQARHQQPQLEYALPKEGATIWCDTMCIPKGTPHKRAAHEWINYILRPEVGAALSNATGYGTPNADAAILLKDPVPYPTVEEQKRLEYQVDLGRDRAVWDRIWSEIKSS